MHSGLGVGTQLGTAAAQLTALAVLQRFALARETPENEVAYLAWLSGRVSGRRSAARFPAWRVGARPRVY